VFRLFPAGFYHWLRIVGSIVVLVHGTSLLADQPGGHEGDAYRAGSAGGAPGELLPSASGINLQTSVIRLHSAKCERTISRHSDVGVFEWGSDDKYLQPANRG
jgi:hypothetical protein